MESDNVIGTRANLTYLDGLAKFHKQQGGNLHRLPYVDKKPLDLYRLKKAVESRGGFDKVCKLKKWAEIGRDLGYSGKIMSSLSTSLKNSYQRWLCPYEEYLRLAKPGVHQQLEQEYGGPLTPSPGQTPVKRSTVNTPSSAKAASPARQASEALQSSLNGIQKEAERDTPMLDAPIAPTSTPSSAPNIGVSGGSIRGDSTRQSSSEDIRDASRNSEQRASSRLSTDNTPDPGLRDDSTPLGKRQFSDGESSEMGQKEADDDEDDGERSTRRSKRLKKGELLSEIFSLGCILD